MRRTQLGCSFHCNFFTQNSVRWGLCTKLFGLCLEIRTLRVPLIVKIRARAPCSADGRNVVGQQIPIVLDVTCCVLLHTLLHVFGSLCTKFETDEPFSSRANGRKIRKMLGVLASNVVSVARGFTSRLSADKKPPKPGDFKSAVYTYHLDSDREV